MVSGLGAQATSAMAANTSSQLEATIHAEANGLMRSSALRSSVERTSRSIAAAALLVSTGAFIAVALLNTDDEDSLLPAPWRRSPGGARFRAPGAAEAALSRRHTNPAGQVTPVPLRPQ